MRLRSLTLALLACATAPSAAMAQDGPSVEALEWRAIGPFNGGRGSTVVGHPTDEHVFFYGHSSGGLWKTDDAGTYWTPVGEGQFRYGSVGAMAIAHSDPDVMYVGLGEPNLRQSVSWGDGMYKSTDGGENWTHIGLPEARQIARVRIHPENADVVYVASMGHTWGPHPDKGVFRTRDGGATWEKVLFISEGTGAIDLIMAPDDPNLLFAAMWEFERKAWGATFGGPEGGLYRSRDGGDTWEEISEMPGLPAGNMGRIGLAMSADDPDRVYAIVDSETKQGLYRSDDRGDNWRLVSDNPNITARPFYFYTVYATPTNADEVWIPGNKLWRSLDAGESWALEPANKDDFQDIWIDAENPDRIIVTSDGGTSVSMTGGLTWSTFANQNGTQFYRVDTDDQFPYRVYANSQDLLAYSVPSRSRWGGIPLHMTDFLAAGETGRVIPKPGDPDISYSLTTGATYGGAAQFTINNRRTGQTETRSVWPEILFGTPASEFRFRFNWQAPFFVSQHEPNTIYFAGNVVFRSKDEGMTWEIVSEDLTHNRTDKMEVAGSPWLPEYFGQEIFSTIHRLAESPHEEGVIWAGSDDGRVHLTRDHTATWVEVTPPDLPEFAAVYEIEPSPHDPATAYIAITRYRKADDYRPYLLKTTDYGQTWSRLDGSFPQDEITRTIREDTERQGLLFVGTETGVFTSIDDGGEWRRLNLNMPSLPVHDIEIKDADVVVATHGRGVWILDDISPLRQYSEELAQKPAHLFQPEDHTRFGYNWWVDYGGGPPSDKKYYFVRNAEAGYTFYERGVVNGERRREYLDAGAARPLGAMIYYLLSEDAQDVSLTILDESGNEIRTFSQDEIPTQRFESWDNRGYDVDLETGTPAASVSLGLNRFHWDMRYPTVSGIPGLPPVLIRPFAKPGTYQVRLTVDGVSETQSFEMMINPNESYTRAHTDAKADFWMQLYDKAEEGVQAVIRAQEIKAEAEAAAEASPGLQADADEVARIADDFIGSMVATGTTLVQIISEPTRPLSILVSLHNVLETSEGPPNASMLAVYDRAVRRIDNAIATFEADIGPAMERLDQSR